MKRPLILLPLLAVVAAAVVVVAIASGSSGGGSSSTSSKSINYGSSPAATAAKPAAPPASAAAARIATADHGLGPMLVDSQGRTLYLWQADTGMSSTCSGECATDWPPATTSGAPHAAGSAKAALLGTTKRSDGTTQVTYAGHPLYRFAGDGKARQVNGQGSSAFGAPWLVVAPGGAAISG